MLDSDHIAVAFNSKTKRHKRQIILMILSSNNIFSINIMSRVFDRTSCDDDRKEQIEKWREEIN
jgi:DNA polymerase IIIc chi subunit